VAAYRAVGDASFLAQEGQNAHMHIGAVAVFAYRML